jgi:hypothetical protein
MEREKVRPLTEFYLVIIIGEASLYFGMLEEFQWANFFFGGGVFCCAGQSKNPDLGARPPE